MAKNVRNINPSGQKIRKIVGVVLIIGGLMIAFMHLFNNNEWIQRHFVFGFSVVEYSPSWNQENKSVVFIFSEELGNLLEVKGNTKM